MKTEDSNSKKQSEIYNLQKLATYFRGDRYMWLIILFLSLFGIAAVYSATGSLAFNRFQGNTERFLIKQFIFISLGIGIMYLIHLVDYKYFSKVSRVLIYLAILAIVFTYIGGSEIKNAKRSLKIPLLGFSFQVFDFAKFALILYVSRFLSARQKEVKSWKTFSRVLAFIVCICALIAPEDLSTSLVLLLTCGLLLFIGRINLKYIGGLILVAVLAFAGLYSFLTNVNPDNPIWQGTRVPTWKSRVESFTKKEGDGSFQTQQAKIAVATGGFFGKGPGNSVQRNILPEAFSDFIFCIIIEEYGLFFGGCSLLFAYLLFFYRSTRVLRKSPNAFGALLAVGLSLAITIQALVHMAVSVSLFPVTGLTLPLISHGGTGVIFTSLAFGIVLSVSRTVDELAEEQGEEV